MIWRWRTRLRLLLAGWRSNRDAWNVLCLPRQSHVFPEAKRILTEFGGLKFGRPSQTIVDLDPAVGDEVAQPIAAFEQKIGRRLFPLGYYEHQDRIHLVVDDDGIVYTLQVGFGPLDSSGHEPIEWAELEPLASSFELAIDYLLRGNVSKSETHGDLESIKMLGMIWKLGPSNGGSVGDQCR